MGAADPALGLTAAGSVDAVTMDDGDPRDRDVLGELMRDRVDTPDGGSRTLSDGEIDSILRNWTVGELATLSASVG